MPDVTPLSLLEKYWGHTSFRPCQLEIIESVLEGRDTLGLLPTGGGKSVTFQIPALMLPGVTLVVTPLISLMKDQVDHLRQAGIKAAAVHSGLTRGEYRLAMERARLGKLKLLYLSPEKLQSPSFADELSGVDVSMIVVDEAHCISQWGYDFRPSYLRIASLRRRYPQAPVLALTASATPDVVSDIMERLEFRGRTVFARSFSRDNLSYIVRHADYKPHMLLRVLRATSGSAIVYARSRRRTREIAEMLVREGISADFYHAGLAPEEKNERQERWKDGRVRVMVATNAFGMGIDKPDVRTVVHIDPPSSLEEYYQEAGRAGRDGLPSFAVVIASQTDKATLTRRIGESFPDKDTIRKVYEHACNFLEVAVGSGYNQLYEFNFELFCERFRFKPVVARNALAILTRAGYIDYTDEISTRSRVMFTLSKSELYDLRLPPDTDAVLQLLLRTYTGLFADFVYISEELIASRLRMTPDAVYSALVTLARQHVLSFVPRKTSPYLFFTTSRELPRRLEFPRAVYEDQKERMEQRVEAMRDFIFNDVGCRVSRMLRYFGETAAADCGKCDVCRGAREPKDNLPSLRDSILYIASHPGGCTVEDLCSRLRLAPETVIPHVRRMADEGLLTLSGTLVSRKC